MTISHVKNLVQLYDSFKVGIPQNLVNTVIQAYIQPGTWKQTKQVFDTANEKLLQNLKNLENPTLPPTLDNKQPEQPKLRFPSAFTKLQ